MDFLRVQRRVDRMEREMVIVDRKLTEVTRRMDEIFKRRLSPEDYDPARVTGSGGIEESHFPPVRNG